MKFKCTKCSSTRVEIKDKKELIKSIVENPENKKIRLFKIQFKCKECNRTGVYHTDNISYEDKLLII